MRKVKLFCFPYAGGNSAIYHNWKEYLDPAIELRPVELAGRGRRINDPFYRNLPEVIEDIFLSIKEEISHSTYAFFGHSMGALIAYELVHKIKQNRLPYPVHVFFSGRGAPHVRREGEKKYHLMGKEEFIEELDKLGGTPRGFFKNPDIQELFLPLLKNDFRIVETITHKDEICPIDVDITVFLGKKEDLSPEQTDGWKRQTNKQCTVHYFKGGHFFIHEEMAQLVKLINAVAKQALPVP
jgi:medium-chain acyl-[acyl-carrier-protein] hydrolase